MQGEKDLREEVKETEKEQEGVEEEEKIKGNVSKKDSLLVIAKIGLGIIVLCMIVAMYFTGFSRGQKSNEIKAKKAQQEANAKVEEAEAKMEDIQREADGKVDEAQQEANSKIQLFESKLQEEYTTKEYIMLENCYDIVCRLRKGETVSLYTLENAIKMEKLSDELPYLSEYSKDIDEKVILENIETLKEYAEKYPLASDLNGWIIYQLERFEKEFKDKIHSVEIFEKIDALRKQCEDNVALWTR